MAFNFSKSAVYFKNFGMDLPFSKGSETFNIRGSLDPDKLKYRFVHCLGETIPKPSEIKRINIAIWISIYGRDFQANKSPSAFFYFLDTEKRFLISMLSFFGLFDPCRNHFSAKPPAFNFVQFFLQIGR